MTIEIPKHIAANPRFADLVAMAHEVFVTPRELSERWQMTVAHLGHLRAANKGPAWIKLGGGAVRYRLSDIVAHEEAGEGGPLSVSRLKPAVASLPDFSEAQRAQILAHMLTKLCPDE